MRRAVSLGLLCALATSVLGCGADGVGAPAESGVVVATAGDVRFSLPSKHRVVVQRRTAHGWGDARVAFEDGGRECGAVYAIAAGSTVAATVGCDEHYAEDQAPTESVALISTDARTWAHRDLDGEASRTPGLSPRGSHAVWAQDDELLTWTDGSFGRAPLPAGSWQVLTVDDKGALLEFQAGRSAGRCTVEVRAGGAGPRQAAVPVAGADKLLCKEVGLSLATPTEVHGDVSGQPGTELVVRRTSAGRWVLAARPPITARGLDVYPDDPARAVWNQLTSNTRGDLIAVGSPDRQHVTAQRYDRLRQRWTPSRVVHVARTRTCRRSIEDSGALQGSAFRLRLLCDGRPIVLRSRTGTTWNG